MHLSERNLFQLNGKWPKKPPAEQLLEMCNRLLHDVKELQDRLNQNPDNTTIPPIPATV